MSYHNLDPVLITKTTGRLRERIDSRFPAASLGKICRSLEQICEKTEERSTWISQPIRPLHMLIWVTVIGILIFAGTPLIVLTRDFAQLDVTTFLQVLEAGINDAVLIGAAIFFLFTLETRFKRRRALIAIHELRTIAHLIDMHQLTKDPERIFSKQFQHPCSPKLNMSPFELRRYLDYCSEMLSLAGKIASLYVQRFDDPVALASASEVEALARGLQSKIWQKIMILHSCQPSEELSSLKLS